MKIKFLAFVMLAASVAMVSCKGDKGELGPQGEQGETGPAGPQGQPGTPAQVIFSNWTDINLTEVDWSTEWPAEEDWYGLKQVFTAPKLTADIVNKGVVLVYVKNSEGTVFNVSGTHRLGVADTYDTDGDGDKDYFTSHVASTFKAGEVKFLAESDDWNATDGWFAYISKSGATLRYVLIPGLEAGRVADLKKMSYKEIAKMYKIQD